MTNEYPVREEVTETNEITRKFSEGNYSIRWKNMELTLALMRYK